MRVPEDLANDAIEIWEVPAILEVGKSCAANDTIDFVLGLPEDLRVEGHRKHEVGRGSCCLWLINMCVIGARCQCGRTVSVPATREMSARITGIKGRKALTSEDRPCRAFNIVRLLCRWPIAAISLFQKRSCERGARSARCLDRTMSIIPFASREDATRTICARTMSYGASIITLTISRTLNAVRLKPAPGIHVGKFLTVGHKRIRVWTQNPPHCRSAAVSDEGTRPVSLTNREEVDNHRTWTARADSFGGSIPDQSDVFVV